MSDTSDKYKPSRTPAIPNEFGYTPAPWHQCTGSHKVGCICGMVWSKAADIPIAAALSSRDEGYTLGCGVDHDSPEYFANARLIAASPDLLCARIEYRKVIERLMNGNRTCSESESLCSQLKHTQEAGIAAIELATKPKSEAVV